MEEIVKGRKDNEKKRRKEKLINHYLKNKKQQRNAVVFYSFKFNKLKLKFIISVLAVINNIKINEGRHL